MTGRAFWCAECYRRTAGESGRFEHVHDQKADEWLDAREIQERLDQV